MDILTVLIKITGAVLFGFTVRSIIKHIKKESKEAKEFPNQSKTERFLNSIILYVWLFFITAFSIGMIANN
jgi:hypothetical protein